MRFDRAILFLGLLVTAAWCLQNVARGDWPGASDRFFWAMCVVLGTFVLAGIVPRLVRRFMEDRADRKRMEGVDVYSREHERRVGAERELEKNLGRQVELENALRWCGGSSDFAPGGKAHEGWVRMVMPLLDEQWEGVAPAKGIAVGGKFEVEVNKPGEVLTTEGKP